MCPRRIAALVWIAFLLMGLLSACAEKGAAQEVLLLDAAGEQAANERTARVERGTLVQEFRTSASVESVREITVYLTADNAQFVEHRVANGQRVEAGEVLSVFRKRSDNVRLAEIEVELARLASEREDGLYDRDKADEDLREQIQELDILPSDKKTYRVYVQGQVLAAQLERSALEREQFLLRLSEQERQMNKEREEILEGERDLTVVAPVSGVVTGLQSLSPGENCESGQAILRLYDPERYLLRAGTGILGELRVGQTVQIEYGPNNGRKTAQGVVVSAESLLPPDLGASGAAVAVEGEIPAADMVNPSITAQEMVLEDALLLPRTAIGSENGQSYVLLRKDGSPRKRFVQIGPQSSEQVVILEGLEEGQEVVLP